MADLVLVAATPHNPLLWRSMVDPVPDDLAAVADNFATISAAIAEMEVDSIVLVCSDHIRQFFADNCPPFVVGKAERYPGVHENEIRTFGMEPCEIPGDRALADEIAGRELLPATIDLGFSNEWLLDHGFVIPLVYLTPDLDVPVVPIHTNTGLPPLPRPQRFVDLGRYLRAAIDDSPLARRVALVASGHLATDIGGPRQFLGGASPDPEFDADAVEWMSTGDLEGAVEGCSFERVMKAGNVTYQFLNVLTALAATDGAAPLVAEGTPSRYAASPFYLWKRS